MSTIKFKNTADVTVKLTNIGLPDVPAGGVIDVPIQLAAPTRRDNGSRGLSPIEKCAPQMKPVDPEIYAAWQSSPEPLPPKSLVVTSKKREADEPAGVRALREAAASLASKAASEPEKGKKSAPTEKGAGT